MIDLNGQQLPATRQLQTLRKARGLKQLDLAALMGVSPSRASYLEGCDIGIVQLRIVDAYVRALGGRLKVSVEFDEGPGAPSPRAGSPARRRVGQQRGQA